ncbi:MAG: hypothetical protein KI790_10455 [Cyclobacteriaceae bacterium]|nr:hypothetical protein [Cyclobacteriaceae bacterium HetDA_MAG_MS6]
MKNTDLHNKTTEKLRSELKTTRTVTGALIGVLVVLFTVTIFGLLTKEDNSTFIALMAVGISCSAIIPSQFSNIKKIKTELDTRK